MRPEEARLLALDWGTTHLRASLLDDSGVLIERRQAESGVMKIGSAGFEEALYALCADWISPSGPTVIASGMIGSRQGWREAPYLECPADIGQAVSQLTQIRLQRGARLFIVPGLHWAAADGIDDVMRGEETQVWGADLPNGALALLPGTHAKWVCVGPRGRIEQFQTYMTGELYAVLSTHSILGRLMRSGHEAPEAFDQGVRLGLRDHARATHLIFGARSAGLMGRLAPEALPDYLSGMLIGIEIAAAALTQPETEGAPSPVSSITLIGASALCERYRRALALAGWHARLAPDDVLEKGLWRIAQAAGLTGRSQGLA